MDYLSNLNINKECYHFIKWRNCILNKTKENKSCNKYYNKFSKSIFGINE